MQRLEQMLDNGRYSKSQITVAVYRTDDLFGKKDDDDRDDLFGSKGDNFGQLIPTSIGGVVPYGDLANQGGDFHDTFKSDRYGNPHDGHTTVNIPDLPGEPLRLPWETDDNDDDDWEDMGRSKLKI